MVLAITSVILLISETFFKIKTGNHLLDIDMSALFII